MLQRLIPLNWIQWLTVLLIPATIIPIVILFSQIQNVQKHQNDALHAIICHAERVVRTSTDLTTSQRWQALKFYRQSLADAHLSPCD